MEKIFNTIVIGGGASGLVSVIELTRGSNAIRGENILLLEKNDRVAKKLITTGNGQGNLSNANLSYKKFHGNDKFISEFFSDATNPDVVKYLSELGIVLTTDEQGRMYPLSKQASVVSDVFRAHIDNAKVDAKTSSNVKNVTYFNNSFKVETNDGVYYAQNVILAVGGSAGKQFGTDGSSYRLAENFGHKKTKVYPSLVQLKTQLDFIRGLKGLKEVVKINAYDGDSFLASATGDLLFTDFGISGSAVFSVSGLLTSAKMPNVVIEFLPNLSCEKVKNILLTLKDNSPLFNENPLLGVLNKRVGQAVIKYANSKDINKLCKAIKEFRLVVTGSLGFDYAQVTKGGIDCNDLSPLSMQSKLKDNLYLTGEMLDVDGDCGGYNLTFAFISAIKAARDIKQKNNKLS